jgi:hypothetical protein
MIGNVHYKKCIDKATAVVNRSSRLPFYEMTPAINNTAVIPFVVAHIEVKKKEVQHHNRNL